LKDSTIFHENKSRGVVSLMEREKHVLHHIWGSLRNREIGKELRISQKTIEAHHSKHNEEVADDQPSPAYKKLV